MDSWPSTLPLPAVRSEMEISPKGVDTEMESGRVRKRRTFQTPLEVITVQWTFLKDQFNAFKIFFDTTLSNGAHSFVLPVYGEDKEVAFLNGTYSHSNSDGLVMVSTALEVRKRLGVFIALSGQHEDELLLAGQTEIALSGQHEDDILLAGSEEIALRSGRTGDEVQGIALQSGYSYVG